MGDEGGPNGVSTRVFSLLPSDPSASAIPVPPMMPSMGRCGDDMETFPPGKQARIGAAR